jgi:hypothetical protein
MQRARHLIVPIELIFLGFSRRGAPNVAVICGVSGFSAFQIGLVLLGSYLDGTLRMSGDDKGLLVHYGVWAILISDPLLLISASFAWYQFQIAFRSLPIKNEKDNRSEVQKIVRPYRAKVTLKDNGIWFYLLCLCLGLFSWINNIYETNNPYKYFNHNVFDSTDFMFGFIANKLVLFTSWVLIYPAVGFVVLSMCFSTYFILGKLKAKKIIEPNILHPDGCYGFSSLGKLNICLLLPYFFAFFVVFALLITHENLYASLVIPFIVLVAVFFLASFITIKPILSQVKSVHDSYYSKLVMDSATLGMTRSREALKFGLERICFGMSSGSPYTRDMRSILIAMRAITAATTILKLALPLA